MPACTAFGVKSSTSEALWILAGIEEPHAASTAASESSAVRRTDRAP